MPRTLVRAPSHHRPRSIGWIGVAWMEYFCRHGPGDVMGQPVTHGDEYTGFIVDCYATDENGRRLYDSGFFSRAKGSDKSGLAARLSMFEALGPSRGTGQLARGGEIYRDPWGLGFEHEFEPGEPLARPVQAPFVRIMATEEGQTGNVYQTIHYNLTDNDCPLFYVPGVDAGVGKVILPHGGEIRPSTASSSSKDGGLETFLVLDETHLYTTPELKRMYEVTTRNLRKRKRIAETWFLETTTMFDPSEKSMAQATFEEAEAIRDGRKKRGRARLLYDHRWGEVEDPRDEAKLRAALIEAYGDAMAWMDLDGLVDEFYTARADIANSRRFFLNAQTSSSDSWIKAHEWAACKRSDRRLHAGDMVTLGLDGSINDDSTCLVAIRVADGHMQMLGAWERPEGIEGEDWTVDRVAVDAAVADAMRTYEVVGFYLDPAHWQDYADKWHQEFAHLMRVKATEKKPLEWWTHRSRAMVDSLERMLEAIREKRVSYTPPDDWPEGSREYELAVAFNQHALNARRRIGRAGVTISKDAPHSPKKIDGIMSATLAYEAASDATAAGILPMAEVSYVPRRIR